MSHKNFKKKKYSPYRKINFDRKFARVWNDMGYNWWLICDEGQEKPDPQRYTNFFCKYAINHPRTKKCVLSYIPDRHKEIIYQWIRMTKAEKKEVHKYEPNAGKIITGWIHKAEILYLEDIRKS